MSIIRFSDIGELAPVDAKIKSKFQIYYIDIYEWTVNNYSNTNTFKTQVVNKLNALLYFLKTDNDVPLEWHNIVNSESYSLDVDERELKRTIVPCYFEIDDIEWDITKDPKKTESLKEHAKRRIELENKISVNNSSNNEQVYTYKSTKSSPTPKEDLFIVTPRYPKVADYDPKYKNIHVSLPLIPSKQCEVSATTRVENMTDQDLLKLYPNTLIRTRSPIMYKPHKGITLDPDLGLLIPVDGFTDAQVRDSIIRYPHIFKLMRIMEDGTYKSFYSDIEIDGELLDTLKIWKYLPESKIIDIDSLENRQEQIEFIKEYTIRRYLLERDVKKIEHKYKIRGTLPEFMTLFMPFSMYEKEGHVDPVILARKCVESRVSYLRSRNPRIGNNPTVEDCVFDSYCCQELCDRSCPKWAQIDYLMMRNNLTSESRPFRLKKASLDKYIDVYESGKDCITIVESKDTINCADAFAYVAVCNEWKGSAMRVRAYHLLFSKYIESLQSSWSSSKTDELQYIEIWTKSCNTLVISVKDYINFKDFQSQVMLQLLQDRERERKKTIVVCPKIDNISGQGKMFNLMISKFKQCSIKAVD